LKDKKQILGNVNTW